MDQMDHELHEAIDASFGDGPAHRPVQERLTGGRRAMRRRRVGAAVGSVALVAFVATSYAVATGGDATSRANDPVSRPSASAPATSEATSGPTTDSSVTPVQQVPSDPDADIELTPTGRLLLAPGVEVLQRVPNPMDLAAPDHSMGVAYTRDGEETWALAIFDQMEGRFSTGGVSSDPARKSFATLEEWLDDQVALQTGDGSSRLTLVRFGAGEVLEPNSGARILQQTGDVSLPANFAGPGDLTAVAEVTFEGARYYVLARQIAGSEPEYFPTGASVGGATLADFLVYAESQYAGGEGLR